MRTLVAVLLLANLVAWVGLRRGWMGWPDGVREPQRWAQQVRPEAIELLSVDQVAALAAAAPRCLQAGPYAAAEAPAAAAAWAAAASVPASAWSDVVDERPGLWLLYMGPYAGRELLARKQDELARRHLAAEPLLAPASGVPAALVPGLVLGRYAERSAAEAALAQNASHGLHTARVVQLRPAERLHLLRLPAVPAHEADRLVDAGPGAGGHRLVACPRPG